MSAIFFLSAGILTNIMNQGVHDDNTYNLWGQKLGR